MQNDLIWLQSLEKGDKHMFSLLFQTYYKKLVLYAGRYIQDQSTCEDIVQNVFLKLWDNRKSISIENSIQSYLLRSVINLCIDELRHNKVIDEYQEHILLYDREQTVDNLYFQLELTEHIDKALMKLPPELRKVFMMSRITGMKYNEIAEEQNISVRTIEVRISKALSLLHGYLKDFFP